MTTTKHALSESVEGIPILIAATASPGTLIHAADVDITHNNEVFLYVMNITAAQVTVTVQWGNTDSNKNMPFKLDPDIASYLFSAGWLCNNGKEIRVFVSSANAIVFMGYVHRRLK